MRHRILQAAPLLLASLNFLVALNWASAAAPPVAKAIQVKKQGRDIAYITVENSFQAFCDLRTGFGVQWFDLKHDPKRKLNLAPLQQHNGFFWSKIGMSGDGSSWMATPGDKMRVLEEGPLRVRVQLTGFNHKYGREGDVNAWKELGFDQIFTFYPDGSVFIAYTLEAANPLPITGFVVLTASTFAWGPNGKGEAHCAGESGANRPTRESPSAFALQWSDGPTYFTDILLVISKGKFPSGYWNEGFPTEDYRAGLSLGSIWSGQIPKGKNPLAFMMRFADDMNGEKDAGPYAQAYQEPDQLSVSNGAVDVADIGDLNGDGFNESEGCYVLTAAKKDGVSFTLRSTAFPRPNPIFKVKGWRLTNPASISVGDRKLKLGKEYSSWVIDRCLVVQIFETMNGDSEISIPAKK
jgi:hypothetical protein